MCGGYTTPRCQNFLLLGHLVDPGKPSRACCCCVFLEGGPPRLSETCCVRTRASPNLQISIRQLIGGAFCVNDLEQNDTIATVKAPE